MELRIKQWLIVLLCLYSASFVIGSTLAPVLAHFEQYEISAKLTTMYLFSCHQQPDRSFWILGYPMALCCRCVGFYLGVVISCIIALANKLKITLKWFIGLAALCLIDIFINYGLGIKHHNTGNITRFIVGIVMGLLFVVTLQVVYERISKKLCSKKL